MSKWLTKPKAFIMYTAKRKPLMFMIFVLSDTSEINQLHVIHKSVKSNKSKWGVWSGKINEDESFLMLFAKSFEN